MFNSANTSGNTLPAPSPVEPTYPYNEHVLHHLQFNYNLYNAGPTVPAYVLSVAVYFSWKSQVLSR